MTTNNVSNQSAATDTPKISGLPATNLANESTFLQLLVAQIKNQDPLNPTDGTQFLSQLAQFSSLEQQLQMNTQLADIKSEIAKLSKSGAP